jgi:cyclopropane fatty-acyl-phospholipid synthase-like methyltransferase
MKPRLALARRWLRFNRLYLQGKTPWDTNISPPELRELIEGLNGVEKLAPGTALDLGCGTGTNGVYLAQQGWQVTGVDFAALAIRQAHRKAEQAGVQARTRFLLGSVTDLKELQAPFDLLFDLGCFHGLEAGQQRSYANEVKRLSRAGSVFLLYAFEPWSDGKRSLGLPPAEIVALFRPEFEVTRTVRSVDTRLNRASNWYTLKRLTIDN